MKYGVGEREVGDRSEVANWMFWDVVAIADACEGVQVETRKVDLCRQPEPGRFFFLPPDRVVDGRGVGEEVVGSLG